MSDPFEMCVCLGCGDEIDEDEYVEFNGYCCQCDRFEREVREEEERLEAEDWE